MGPDTKHDGMTTRRALIGAGAAAVLLSAAPAMATSDFRDVPVLFAKVSETLETAPTDMAVTWQNPETGNHGTITVTRTFFLSDGSPCRDYTRTTLQRDRPMITETGTGCREDNGAWTLHEGGGSSGAPESVLPPASSGSGSDMVVTPLTPPPVTTQSPTPRTYARVESPPPPAPPPAVTPEPEPEPAPEPAMKAKAPPKIVSATIPTRSD